MDTKIVDFVKNLTIGDMVGTVVILIIVLVVIVVIGAFFENR